MREPGLADFVLSFVDLGLSMTENGLPLLRLCQCVDMSIANARCESGEYGGTTICAAMTERSETCGSTKWW